MRRGEQHRNLMQLTRQRCEMGTYWINRLLHDIARSRLKKSEI